VSITNQRTVLTVRPTAVASTVPVRKPDSVDSLLALQVTAANGTGSPFSAV